jgi:hypothetical protein
VTYPIRVRVKGILIEIKSAKESSEDEVAAEMFFLGIGNGLVLFLILHISS